MKQEMNLTKLVQQFNSEEKCRQYIAAIRWPEGIICPRCGAKSISSIYKRNQLDCNSCRHQFSPTSGTSPLTDPPRRATSLTKDEDTKLQSSLAAMNTVSIPVRFRFICAI